ncbi:hypothetical protein SAMN05660199_00171 [Klenkia soli]|uniref:Uncharacterized protein n=1 Tax=Klenkia soli TaxID=1052260 RepID=A0A1H0C0H5_9ACTN|nr:hypothetical protein [Klenkia soli]SDN51418.1 hypothetical protein SAMN05660199_00171 [Klenkia soli]
MNASSASAASRGRRALVRQYGEQGASYLEHLQEVTGNNRYLQSAIDKVQQRAEERDDKKRD